MAERTVGDLAMVLHSHMPYVEGFGTYPFGEEWLFDAFARSHLPVLEVAERVTMTITPVLADQLEADGVGERMSRFLRRHRIDAADRDVADADLPRTCHGSRLTGAFANTSAACQRSAARGRRARWRRFRVGM